MPGNYPGTPANSLANTTLTDRELLIHAVQHLEVLHELVNDMYEQLSVFRPLLARLAPGGKPDMIALMQARREMRRT